MRAPTVLTGLALGTGLLLAGPGVALAEGPLPAGRVVTEPAPVTPAPAQEGESSEPVHPETPVVPPVSVPAVPPVVPTPPVTAVPAPSPTPSERPVVVQPTPIPTTTPTPASPTAEPRRTAATPSTDVPAPGTEPSTIGPPPPGTASVLPPQPMLLDRVVVEESMELPAVTPAAPAIPSAPAPASTTTSTTTTTTESDPVRTGSSAPAELDDDAAGAAIDGAVAQGEMHTAGAFSVRYLAAGILGVVALGLAVAVGAALQPRRIRRTH